MKPERENWNRQQKILRQILSDSCALADPFVHSRALDLFLNQHAALHAPSVSRGVDWSFEEEVWKDLSEDETRSFPTGGEHSVAWLLWHSARIEDVTMNVLAAGQPQLFERGGWQEKLKIAARDTGNAMSLAEAAGLSAAIDLDALRAYRRAVGCETRRVAACFQPGELILRIQPERLRLVSSQGALKEEAGEVLAYWGGLTLAGLLLMPPTRHNFIHLNEALRVKSALKKQPKTP